MLAKFKKLKWQHTWIPFKWELKVIEHSRDRQRVKLENWYIYNRCELELKKESWGSRYRKQKQEVVESKKEETIEIDIWRVNMELRVWEYETRIKQLIKECESWMIDFNNAKQEKIEFENKYNDILNTNKLLNERISLLVELQEQLISKKELWRDLFLISIIIDITYLLIKYLWI